MNTYRIAWRNLRRNQRRTLGSISSVAFGAMAILLAGGFMEFSFNGLRESTIRTDLGHLQLTQTPHGASAHTDRLRDYTQIANAVSKQEQVRFSMARLDIQGLISVGDNTEVFLGRGIDADKELTFSAGFAPITQGVGLGNVDLSHMLTPAGSPPADDNKDEILLAEGLAQRIGAKVGDWATVLVNTDAGALNGMDLKIVGFYKPIIPEHNERAALLPLQTAQALLRTDEVSRLIVVLRDTDQTDQVLSDLSAKHPELTITPWYELAVFYDAVVRLYRTIFGFMGVIILIVVIITTFNTLMMTVLERVTEIATMMAVGVPRRQVVYNFMVEGGLIGLLGAFSGALGAILATLLINALSVEMPPPPGSTQSYPLNIMWVYSHYLLIFLLMGLAATAAAWIPARKAAKLNIAQALRSY